MSKIKNAFNNKAFVAFITCGDPDLDTTIESVLAAVRGGATLIELGIPFSDPTAEGPVIEQANMRALTNGVTTDKVFDMVKKLRSKCDVPLCFMTYANVVFSYGTDRFLQKMKENDMDGIILPDVPFEEKHEFCDACEAYGIDFISLIAPTSHERIEKIAKEAKGFIYVVSSLGVTGTRSKITTNVEEIVTNIKQFTDVPCAIGFGISSPEQVQKMSAVSDGVIVGSAIIKLLAEYGKDAPPKIEAFVRDMLGQEKSD